MRDTSAFGNFDWTERSWRCFQSLDDGIALRRTAHLIVVTEHSPNSSLVIKRERFLEFFDISSAAIQGCSSLITIEDQHGIHCAGQPGGRTDVVKWIVLRTLFTSVMAYTKPKTELICDCFKGHDA